MLIQPTLDTLNRLKLHGMALALSRADDHQCRPAASPSRSASRCCSSARRSPGKPAHDAPAAARQLKYRDAVIEDLDYRVAHAVSTARSSRALPPASGSARTRAC